MSIVVINAVTVPAENAEMFEQRFAARAGEVGKSEGFEAFEVLKPADGSNRYLVYTRWRAREDFDRWMQQRYTESHGSGAPPVSSGNEVWTFEVIQSEYA